MPTDSYDYAFTTEIGTLSPQIDSTRTMSCTDSILTDICIIGSGPGGGFAAAALARSGRDVLVLEAGSATHSERADEAFASINIDGTWGAAFSRALQLGGSSNLWAGRLSRLESIDYEARPWVPHSGWPIAAQDLAPYYEQALHEMGMPAIQESCARLTKPRELQQAIDDEALEAKVFFWNKPPFKVGEYLQRVAAETSHLRILLDARVLELHETQCRTAISEAIVMGGNRRKITVQAKIFVLAAGGLETPRILLNSTKYDSAGLGNEHDLVGRFLSTHPKADIGLLLMNRAIPTSHPFFSDRPVGSLTQRVGLGFSANYQRKARLLNHYVQLSPVTEYRASQVFEAIRRSSAIQSPLIERSAMTRGLLSDLGHIAFEAVSKLSRLQPRARTFMLRAFLDQHPSPECRVTLSKKACDSMGMPKIDLNWSFSDDDRTSALRFFERLDSELTAYGIGHVSYEKLKRIKDWPLIGVHSHFMGTTRMAHRASEGVVNRDARVFGLSNLYISGPSVFATYGYANTFLPTAALSLRLADHLQRGNQSIAI